MIWYGWPRPTAAWTAQHFQWRISTRGPVQQQTFSSRQRPIIGLARPADLRTRMIGKSGREECDNFHTCPVNDSRLKTGIKMESAMRNTQACVPWLYSTDRQSFLGFRLESKLFAVVSCLNFFRADQSDFCFFGVWAFPRPVQWVEPTFLYNLLFAHFYWTQPRLILTTDKSKQLSQFFILIIYTLVCLLEKSFGCQQYQENTRYFMENTASGWIVTISGRRGTDDEKSGGLMDWANDGRETFFAWTRLPAHDDLTGCTGRCWICSDVHSFDTQQSLNKYRH